MSADPSMAYHYRRDSKQSNDSTEYFQRLPSEYVDGNAVPSSRDSLPKYYPKDHEVTKWLVNQMRCRNGLHHLVNLANVQPTILSAYFEIFDQPHIYIDARTGPGMSAYGIKTVLYLTPLAIAVYLRLRSVMRLLLDTSGTRIHTRARQEINVNAVCYVRRTKPRPGPFVMDEYSTTYPAIIAVRREFFAGLSILMSSNFHPQAPIGIVEKLGTTRESTYWFVDLLDFCVKLLSSRPGVDVIGLLQTISYRSLSDTSSPYGGYYDPCVYDVRLAEQDSDEANAAIESKEEIWCSVFHRLTRKGASRSYSNCGNRLIGLLEYIGAAGFFRQLYMPKGPVAYTNEFANRRLGRIIGARKMSPDMIGRLDGLEKDIAQMSIAVDRDTCLCLLTLWLERVRNRCLERQAQRLLRLLTTSLVETGLLEDFIQTPNEYAIKPDWLFMGLARLSARHPGSTQNSIPIDFLEDDANEICELELPQVNEIKREVRLAAHNLGLANFSEKLYNVEYQKPLAMGGAIGDSMVYNHASSLPITDEYKTKRHMTAHDSETEQTRYMYEEYTTGRKNRSRASTGGSLVASSMQRRPATGSGRLYWSSPTRNPPHSPPIPPQNTNNCEKLNINIEIQKKDEGNIEDAKEVEEIKKITPGIACSTSNSNEIKLESNLKQKNNGKSTPNKKVNSVQSEANKIESNNPTPRLNVWRNKRKAKKATS